MRGHNVTCPQLPLHWCSTSLTPALYYFGPAIETVLGVSRTIRASRRRRDMARGAHSGLSVKINKQRWSVATGGLPVSWYQAAKTHGKRTTCYGTVPPVATDYNSEGNSSVKSQRFIPCQVSCSPRRFAWTCSHEYNVSSNILSRSMWGVWLLDGVWNEWEAGVVQSV